MFKRISLLLLAFSNSVTGQVAIERVFDTWNDISRSSEQSQNIREDLESLLSNPLSIQQRDPFILTRHPLISEMEAVNICYHIQRSGFILDWHELNDIAGIDEEWIELRKPFLTLEPPSTLKLVSLNSFQSTLVLGFMTQYPRIERSPFLGSPFQDQGKFTVSTGAFRASLRWQRDIGEPIDMGFYDHHNGFIEFAPPKGSYRISLGSFRTGFGSGLLTGTSFGVGLISEGAQLHRTANQTKASAPGTELQHWTGCVVHWHNSMWDLRIAGGYAKRDARIDGRVISSFIQTGLHRTSKEIERRKNTQLYHFEGQLKLHQKSFLTSIYYGMQLLPLPFLKRKVLGGTSFHIQWMRGINHLQGEVSMDLKGSPALVLSYTRGLGDWKVGGRIYHSTASYTPMLESSNGIYFSGSAQTSREIFVGTSFRDNKIGLSGYFAKKHLDDFNQQNAKGLQFNFHRRQRKGEATLRLTYRNQNQKESIYGRATLQSSLESLRLTLRGDVHHGLDKGYSQLLQVGFEQTFSWLKIRSRFSYYSSHQSELPLYAMTLSTSLQMRILRLSGTGSAIDLWFEIPISHRLKVQCSVLYDTLLRVDSRGSASYKTKGPDKWTISLEMHAKLGAR